MKNSELSIKLAHLYPKLLNIYGDYGNIIALRHRCKRRGIGFEVVQVEIGDEISPNEADIFFMGGGQDEQQKLVSVELQRHAGMLLEQSNADKVFLAICGGYQLLGEYYKPFDEPQVKGISLLDAYTEASDKRYIGNVVANTDFLPGNTLVGFENHSGLTFLHGDTKPLAKLTQGGGNNGKDGFEGARKNNVFGTYLHGSLLPKNPEFADYLLGLALKNKYGKEIELERLDDTLELSAHSAALHRAY